MHDDGDGLRRVSVSLMEIERHPNFCGSLHVYMSSSGIHSGSPHNRERMMLEMGLGVSGCWKPYLSLDLPSYIYLC